MVTLRQMQWAGVSASPRRKENSYGQFLVLGSASLDAAEEGRALMGPPTRCVASNLDPTLSPSIRTKCAAAPSGQSLHPFPSVGLLDPMRRGHLQGSTRAISDNGLEHWQEERRVSE